MNMIVFINNIDKKLLDICDLILESIKNGNSLKNPPLLMSFLLLTYVDLKKYCFNYWFGFPVLSTSSSFTSRSISRLDTLLKTPTSSNWYLITMAFNRNTKYFVLLSRSRRLSINSKIFASILNSNLGWPLRNFLYSILHTWGNVLKEVEILCYRGCWQHARLEVFDWSFWLVEGMGLSSHRGDDDPLSKITGWDNNK
uniref:Ubiquitin-like modifier-activating enzyme Atg7 N-terminal domain-containing protein n=1 Tax=Amphimedon queenslandica TaxID=400682 RepID=A0A1X7SI75_AMPQE